MRKPRLFSVTFPIGECRCQFEVTATTREEATAHFKGTAQLIANQLQFWALNVDESGIGSRFRLDETAIKE